MLLTLSLILSKKYFVNIIIKITDGMTVTSIIFNFFFISDALIAYGFDLLVVLAVKYLSTIFCHYSVGK